MDTLATVPTSEGAGKLVSVMVALIALLLLVGAIIGLRPVNVVKRKRF